MLNEVDNFSDLFEKVNELKLSNKAQNFRNAINVLEKLIQTKDNKNLNKILMEIENSAEEWQNNINKNINPKKVNISIPLVGVNSDFDIPMPKLTVNPSDDILVFIHELLLKS